jgi:hypothetical protein
MRTRRFSVYDLYRSDWSRLEQRYKERIRYITFSSLQSGYALHVLQQIHEKRPMKITMSLLHQVHKRRPKNSLENLNFFNGISLSMNNLRKMKTPFLISSMIYTSNTHAHNPLSLSPIWWPISVQRDQQTQHHRLRLIRAFWEPFPIHVTIYNFVYLSIFKYLLLLIFFLYISGRCHHIHSIQTRNSAQIILSLFYILT